MKRTVAAVVFGSLLLVACGSDESSSDTLVEPEPTTTEAAATTTDAAVDTTVADAAALVPEAVVASTRDETVSHTARRMLLDGLSTPSSTEDAIDAAIASLLEARDRLGHA